MHITLKLHFQTPDMANTSRSRPGFISPLTDNHVQLTRMAARTIDKFLGTEGTRHALANYTTDVVSGTGQHASAADILDAAAAASSNARPRVHPDIVGLHHMVNPIAYLH